MTTKKLLAGMIVLASSAAWADEAAMQAQLDAMQKEIQELKAAPKVTKVDGGFRAASADGVYQFRAIGSLFVDTAFYDKDVKDLGSGSAIRRGRLGFRGSAAQNWDFKFEVSFAGETASFTEYYLGYKGIKDSFVYIGNTAEFYSFEEITSTNQTLFMERSFGVATFEEDYDLGLAYLYWKNGFTVGAGVYGDNGSKTQTAGPGKGKDEGLGTAVRVTWAPMHDPGNILHVGASMTWRDPAGDTSSRSTRADTRITDVKLVETGTISNVKDYGNLGVEAAWVGGPVTVQGEYVMHDIRRESGSSDLSFHGGYIQAAYMLTGEKRTYYHQYAVFDGIKPLDANKGAWELGIRYDTVDLNDGAVRGGKQQALTLGLNYYVNYNLRFMLNAIQVQSKGGVDDDPRILQARAALYF